MDINQHIIESIQAQANSLLHMAGQDRNDYQGAVELIDGMSGKLIFTGMGKSGIIARKLAATYSSTGIPSFFVHPGEAYHGDLGMIEANDLLFAISNSGHTPELLNLLQYSRTNNVIGLSQSHDSALAQFSTVHLECKVDKEICPLNLAPTTSTTAALVMGDAICAALMELRKFSQDDFAKFHPGGTLGRSLLTKAKDVMITDVPMVQPEDGLYEVLLRISEGRLGLVAVGIPSEVQGVITDGDIRRAMASSSNPNALVAAEMGTKNPIYIDEHMGMSDMDRLFRENKIITVLVGSKQDLKGVVQFYDIHG